MLTRKMYLSQATSRSLDGEGSRAVRSTMSTRSFMIIKSSSQRIYYIFLPMIYSSLISSIKQVPNAQHAANSQSSVARCPYKPRGTSSGL